MEKEFELFEEQRLQIEEDTRSQSHGTNIYKHRAGRIGASQNKVASHTNPALPSQSLIQSICYPELNKVFSKAIMNGCKHEGLAISAYEHVMKEKRVVCSSTKNTPGYMLPQTFSVLVTVVEKGVKRSSVLFALTIVTLKAMFLKVRHV